MTEDSKQSKPDKPKRGRDRPPLQFPEPIDDTPENIAKAMFGIKPKKRSEWQYVQDHLRRK